MSLAHREGKGEHPLENSVHGSHLLAACHGVPHATKRAASRPTHFPRTLPGPRQATRSRDGRVVPGGRSRGPTHAWRLNAGLLEPAPWTWSSRQRTGYGPQCFAPSLATCVSATGRTAGPLMPERRQPQWMGRDDRRRLGSSAANRSHSGSASHDDGTGTGPVITEGHNSMIAGNLCPPWRRPRARTLTPPRPHHQQGIRTVPGAGASLGVLGLRRDWRAGGGSVHLLLAEVLSTEKFFREPVTSSAHETSGQ